MTHTSVIERLKKIISIVAVALNFATSLGQYQYDNLKKITTRRHKRKTKSLFRL